MLASVQLAELYHVRGFSPCCVPLEYTIKTISKGANRRDDNRPKIPVGRDDHCLPERSAAYPPPGGTSWGASPTPGLEAGFRSRYDQAGGPDAVPNRVIQTSPNRLSIHSMTLTALIYAAYGNGGFNTSMRVTGGPDWVNKTAFSVEGLASGPAAPRQQRLMLQTLLDERFALKVRSSEETADSVLALVV